jgi:hypothetical protein
MGFTEASCTPAKKQGADIPAHAEFGGCDT